MPKATQPQQRVAITVLDEADHMADLGFLPGVTRILAATPVNGQRLLFSATLDNGVNTLVKRFRRIRWSTAWTTHPSPGCGDDPPRPARLRRHPEARVVQELASGEGRRLLFTRTKAPGAQARPRAQPPTARLRSNCTATCRRNARERGLKPSPTAARPGHGRQPTSPPRGIHVDDVGTGRPRRSAGRAQGLPAPLRTHRPGRQRRRCGHPRSARAAPRLPDHRPRSQDLGGPVAGGVPAMRSSANSPDRRQSPVAPEQAPAAAARPWRAQRQHLQHRYVALVSLTPPGAATPSRSAPPAPPRRAAVRPRRVVRLGAHRRTRRAGANTRMVRQPSPPPGTQPPQRVASSRLSPGGNPHPRPKRHRRTR